jgi:hypothetical protein
MLRALSACFNALADTPYDASRSWEKARSTCSEITPDRLTFDTCGIVLRLFSIFSVSASSSR